MHLNSNIVSGKKKANSDTKSPDIYFDLHSIRPFLETNHAFFVLAPAYSVNGCTTPPAYSVTQLICGESVRQSACFSISSFFCRTLTYVNSPLLFLTAPRICYNYIVSNGFSERRRSLPIWLTGLRKAWICPWFFRISSPSSLSFSERSRNPE